MISYAQNAEDVVLARLFTGTTGRYVDVGAGEPVVDSVTWHFYQRGWRGVNVEPIPSLVDQLREQRPDDVSLPILLGAEKGTATLHLVDNRPGWSTVDDELAGDYRGRDDLRVRDIDVEQRTLADVLDEHPGPIDFLKIDVEGAERAVIEGADWSRHRPRVVVVEATRPGSPVPAHQEWEPLLLAAGYRCVLFDGLNRFYALADDTEAADRLAAPANVFDAYERADVADGRSALADLRVGRVAEIGYIRRLEEAVREAQEGRAKDAGYVQTLEHALREAQQQSTKFGRRLVALEHRVVELEQGPPAPPAPPSLPEPLTGSQPMATPARIGAPFDPAAARAFVAEANATGGTYHRLDLGDGYVINGDYDMTKYLPYYHLPTRMDGLRVLDVGTATGFFAIESARRGADVTAIDIWPDECMLARATKVFDLGVRYVTKNIYDLDSSFGQFDVVVCGSLLLHLPDQLGAIRALRTVVGERLILSSASTPDSAVNPEPVCHFFGERATDGDYWFYWGLSAVAMTRMLVAADFTRVTDVEHFDLATEGGRVDHATPHVAMSAYV